MYESINHRVRQGLGWVEVGDHRNLQEDFDLGSVTNPTGTVNGKDMSKLVDVFTGSWGGVTEPIPPNMAQWQMVVMLGSAPNMCARVGMQGDGHYGSQEIVLWFAMIGYADVGSPAPVYPPAEALPLTFQGNGAFLTTSDGVHRMAEGNVMQATRQGNSGKATAATGGTVTFTRMDAGGYEGSYQLTFPNAGSAAGSFSSPWCGTVP